MHLVIALVGGDRDDGAVVEFDVGRLHVVGVVGVRGVENGLKVDL